MKRSEGFGVVSIIVGLVILAILMWDLAVPSFPYYIPAVIIGVGTLVSILFLGIGMLGKE